MNWLSAGRRWRKTTLGTFIATNEALKGPQIIWGAPTYKQVRIAWDMAYEIWGGYAEFAITRNTITFPDAGRIIYLSLDDPDNARGYTADGVILDEVGYIKQIAFYEILRPMLVDTGGWLWGLGTPNGRNWFWKEHVAAKDREDSMSWQTPTLGVEIKDGRLVRKPHPLENPYIAFAEIQEIFRTSSQRTFEQEILAEFLEGEGAVFRNIAACLNAPKDATPGKHKGHNIVSGWDWGKHNDYTVGSIGCAECKQELVLYRSNKLDYSFQRGRLGAFQDRWNMTTILAESNAMGEPIIEELQLAGLPVTGFQTTASSKPPLIENLALALEREEFQFLDVPVATAELEAFERKVNPTTQRSSYSAPEGLHDDTVIARALMLRAATSGLFSMVL